MGRDRNESSAGARQTPKKGRTNQAVFSNFNPAKEELASIKVMADNPGEVLTALDDVLKEGVSVTLSYQDEDGAGRLMTFNPDEDYDTRHYLVIRASTPYRAIAMLAYAYRQGRVIFEPGPHIYQQLELAF